MSTYDPHVENLKARRIVKQMEEQTDRRLKKEREYREGMASWDKARLADVLGGLCIKCQIFDVTDHLFYCDRCKK